MFRARTPAFRPPLRHCLCFVHGQSTAARLGGNRRAQAQTPGTAQPVRHDSPETIYAELAARCAAAGDPRIVLTFPVELPANTSAEQVEQWLSASGFTKVQAEREVATPTGPRKVLDVVADRFRLGNAEKARVIEAIEVALKRGTGRLNVYRLVDEGDAELWRFSTGLHCPDSDLRYSDPIPSAFSFNSAVGACDSCRGFGRVIGVDYGLVIPNDKLTLRAGAIKTIQTPAWKEAQDDLMRHAEAAGIPRDTPWYKLTDDQKKWVIGGTPGYKDGQWSKQWYGIKRFFEYLESKAYKMHIRVLLSKYRSYTPCPTCAGARLKTESLLWRIGRKEDADAVLEPGKRFMPEGVQWSREQLEALPGLCLHDLMLLPIDRLRQFFARMQLPALRDYELALGVGGHSVHEKAAALRKSERLAHMDLAPAAKNSTVGTTTEVWHFLRLLYVKLGTQHCTKDGAAVQPQTPESIAAQLLTQFRGQHIGLLAPLVMNRKGVYTELADWARPRGYTHLRVDGNFLPTTNFPRIDRFKEHTIELPVASLDVSPENEAALRTALADALTHGKGVVHVLSGITGLREAMEGGQSTAGIGTLQAFSTKRACPVCATSYAELDPRLFSYNSKHGWCPDCVGTGVKLTKDQRKVFDDSVQDDKEKGREQTFAEPEHPLQLRRSMAPGEVSAEATAAFAQAEAAAPTGRQSAAVKKRWASLVVGAQPCRPLSYALRRTWRTRCMGWASYDGLQGIGSPPSIHISRTPITMNAFKFLMTCTALAATSVLLVACGGGNNDDPSPSNEPGVLTVSNATIDGLNGVYGNGALNLTDVDKKNPVGSVPELCTFRFDGANKVGSSATAFGDIRYRPDATSLHQVFLTFDGKEYGSGEPTDTAVVRESDQVRFSGKTLTASDGSGATLRVSGIVPMRPNRPSGSPAAIAAGAFFYGACVGRVHTALPRVAAQGWANLCTCDPGARSGLLAAQCIGVLAALWPRCTLPIVHAPPAKPVEGAPCNGCGLCCLAEPCPLGVLVSRRRRGACVALRWSDVDQRYWCGMVADPAGVTGLTHPWAVRAMSALARRWIASGVGCDARLDVQGPPSGNQLK
eukprot:gene9178-9260_t